MKQLITTYTFSAAAKQISLTEYTSLDLNRLLLITNVTDNIIIYNFADPSTGATILGNVITLGYNTIGMNDTDTLQIFYDVETTPASDEQLKALQDQNVLLRKLVKNTDGLATVDLNQRIKFDLDGYQGTTLTATGLTTRILDSGGSTMYTVNGSTVTTLAAIPELWRTIDNARIAYNTGIRSNLTF